MKFILVLLFIELCRSTCPSIQYNNMQYITPFQLGLYNISDNCTITCNTGYYGDLCQSWAQYANMPQGPWNQAGYYTVGQGIVRNINMDLTNIRQIQYTGSDSILVGIQLLVTQVSLVQISLYSKTITLILSPPTNVGAIDALVVRYGLIYVARTFSQYSYGPFDVAVYSSPFNAQKLFPITERALVIEVFRDKGTTIAFIYTFNKNIISCYPSNKCLTWLSSYPTGTMLLTGILCGIDCPYNLYVSYDTYIYKLNAVITSNTPSVSSTLVMTSPSRILCWAGDAYAGVMIYRTSSSLFQVNLIGYKGYSISLGSPGASCSLDISDLRSQIMLFQSNALNTLEALQYACSYKQSSLALFSNSTSSCYSCPDPPENANHVVGSVTCDWTCSAPYIKKGSWCVSQIIQPCPAYYIAVDNGLCTPSLQPWAASGSYVVSVAANIQSYSSALSMPNTSPNPPPYLFASNSTTAFMTSGGYIYYSTLQYAWIKSSMPTSTINLCLDTNYNNFYYMSWNANILWVAFTKTYSASTNCLWALNSTDPSKLVVLNYWQLGAQLCSLAAGSNYLGTIYPIFCNANYISQLTSTGMLPLAGKFDTGYNDGMLTDSMFKNPSSVVYYNSRLYIADKGNCVIREVDLVRGNVNTVAGVQGVCQRSSTTVVYPTNLVYSAFSGFFLFLDQYPYETYPSIRQLHVPTFTLQTIQAALFPPSIFPITSLVGFTDRILVASSNLYYHISASTMQCPSGTTTQAGVAMSIGGCYPCYTGYFSTPTGCKTCSTPNCSKAGQLIIPCQPDMDAYCGNCTNKPSNVQSIYTGPSTIPGSVSGGGDCPWAYIPPCPIGYYSSNNQCLSCPPFSTTISTGKTSISDCKCLGNGVWNNNQCTVPSPYTSMPDLCDPLHSCQPYVEPSSVFNILPSCNAFITQSSAQVCPCDYGQYIAQIYPWRCMQCPSGLYGPTGKGCQNCPMFMEPSLSQMECKCSIGSQNIMVESNTPVCACGPGKAFDTTLGCHDCPANSFNNNIFILQQGMEVTCTPCNAGQFAAPGSIECTPCGLGKFRPLDEPECLDCPSGQYSPDPTQDACTDCSVTCDGMLETICPTDSTKLICSECPEPRPNSNFNGKRNCTTDCNSGFYELDGICTECTEFNLTTCPAGWILIPCAAYYDASCIPCVNSTKPLNFAEWTYSPDVNSGPNTLCTWDCIQGYTPQPIHLPAGLGPIWECALVGTWSVWDLFTL